MFQRGYHKDLFKGSLFKLVIQQHFGVKEMLPSLYRNIMAINETACGVIFMLFFLPSIFGNLANFLLLLQYFDYLFSNIYTQSKLDKSGSVVVFIILLVSRVILMLLTRNTKSTKSQPKSKKELEREEDDEESGSDTSDSPINEDAKKDK